MSIDEAIQNDPKLKAIVIAAVKSRKDEIAAENRQLDVVLGELEDNSFRLHVTLPQASKAAKANGKRMPKGEAESRISDFLRGNENLFHPCMNIAKATSVSPSTAWRALRKLVAAKRVTEHADQFRWNGTNLPVAGGNGKGTEA